MSDCTCECKCKPDSISFWWMNDNHTFIRIKGKNLEEIVKNIKKVRKKSPSGMLCQPKLLINGRDFRNVGINVYGFEGFEEDLLLWIKELEKDKMAMDLIAQGKIEK